MDRRLRIAIYMRLSKQDAPSDNAALKTGDLSPEDGLVQEESNSIRMQRMLLRAFVEEHFRDYELLEFEDDGYSGTNFQRPGVTALLELVRSMAVDCIIVKDFSRFSRDYIELGAYMEQIFPFMGVRFISVNDGYDSGDAGFVPGELEISFKNLLYDLYSRDLSVKVKSSLAVRKERGQYISANSPFGYKKAADDRHMLLVAGDEAEVVRRIFQLAAQGFTAAETARLFNRKGIKTPIQFRLEKGETRRAPKNGLFIWQASTVCQILHNQVYVGDVVYGKTEKETVGGRNLLKPRGEWKIYKNHHEPIVDRDTFETVQRRQEKVREKTKEPPHALTGKLVCGGCGRNLYLRRGQNSYFVCPCLYVNPRSDCVRRVDASWLEKSVLSEMRKHIRQALEAGELEMRLGRAVEEELREWGRKARRARNEEKLLKKQKAEMYVAYSEGREGHEGCHEREGHEGCHEGDGGPAGEEASLKAGLEKLEKRIEELEAVQAQAEERIRSLKDEQAEIYKMPPADTLDMEGLTGQKVSELIDKIVVFGEERMKIYWRECGN